MAVVLPFSPVAAPAAAAQPGAALAGRAPGRGGRARRGGSSRRRWSSRGSQDQRLGRILVANGADLAATTSARRCRGSRGSGASTSPPARPTRSWCAAIDPYRCLALEAVPWRQIGGTRVVAIANPDERRGGDGGLRRRRRRGWRWRSPRRRTSAGRSPRPSPDGCATTRASAARRRSAAAAGRPARNRGAGRGGRGARSLAAVAAAPLLALQVVMGWVLLANAMTMGLRLVALFARLRAAGGPRPDAGTPRLADYKKLPRVSILVPLKREEAVAERLLEALHGDGLSGGAPRHQAGARGGRRDHPRRDRPGGAAADDRGGDRARPTRCRPSRGR